MTHYQLYAGSGQLLRGGTLSGSNSHVIDISTLPQGIYFLRLSNGYQAQTLKFAKP